MTDMAAAREYAAAHPRTPAIDIARKIGCTEADAMVAISDSVTELPATALDEALESVRGWGRILALVRNADAVAEIEAPGDGHYVRDGWLNWITDGYNLHVRVAELDCLLALTREGMHGTTHSINLVNARGDVFFRIYAREDAARLALGELRNRWSER